MTAEENGRADEADKLFHRAWQESTQDFEKFISAYFIARRQDSASERLRWFETALDLALKINDDSVRSALPYIYRSLAACHVELCDPVKAKTSSDLASRYNDKPSDKGPFYHGTRAALGVGDLLTPGGASNYKDDLKMNHIYFTAMVNGAGLAAALAKGDEPERIYIVEPTGVFENDPNVTDKKFPGNPTRSYRSAAPLKIVGEVRDWVRVPPEEVRKWRERLANNKGEIIN